MLRLNIRSQIQSTIIFLSVFSFIVIGIATISFFILRFNRNNEERLSKSIQVMANEVNTKMNSLQAFDDMPDNIGVQSGLEKPLPIFLTCIMLISIIIILAAAWLFQPSLISIISNCSVPKWSRMLTVSCRLA
jgi:Flp pilus assembly protein TadB